MDRRGLPADDGEADLDGLPPTWVERNPGPWWNTWLYRCYGAAGRLLYVGVTADLERRLRTHKREAAWFGEVARVRAEEWTSKKLVYREERRVIREERPRYNRTYNVGRD